MWSSAQSNRHSTNARISSQRIGRRSQGNANRQNSSNRPSGERLENDVNTPLPPYIRRPPRHIRERDVQYFTEKDALTIPDDEFRDELLGTYVKIIHTFMPALDFDKFVMLVIKSDGSEPVSLLLFQAVMFASVIFVNSEILRPRRFSSRKAARKVFFSRVRILYGLDCEPDPLTLVQALLLMTYWYDSPDDEKDTWYWMGITLSLTQVLGLHRDPETSNLSPQEKRSQQRIWWSCYIRDRALALSIRRPARIREAEYLVSMLKLHDFDMVQHSPELVGFFKACGFTTVEEDRSEAICQICIELAKLCACIGEILHTRYSVISREPINYESCKNIAVLPRDPNQQMLDLTRCDSMLEEWNMNQKATSYVAGNDWDNWVKKLIWLHQALLRMTYLSAIGALHRLRALTSLSSPSVSSPGLVDMIAAKKASMRKVREAAVSMTNLAFDLQSKKFLRYFSTSSVPAFLSATLIHLLDVVVRPNQ
ncbi:fungal-specific transcription factor domain-containing protein [Bipolaris maydis]|nr:fungal-specific transcription factor domain-containing protein [Bipolaris maydis]